MSITLRHFCAAVRLSLATRQEEERAEREHLRAKREQQQRDEAAWQAELQRREEAELDADGSREAARIALQEQQEQERLDFIASTIVQQQIKLSARTRWHSTQKH